MKSEPHAKYLIIGAGPVGLATARAFKERGLPYLQVDASDDIGGNWYHGVYKTAHIISSKKITEYPDFRMPASYPDFPSAKQMLDYYKSYADAFDLRENIRLNTKVVQVVPIEDSKWKATYADRSEQVFTGVVVCNGHHWDKKWANIDGSFSGDYIHSKDYKDPAQLIDKRVLVIGSGNSACDIASEASRVGAKAAISMRSGTWFFPKTFMGKPLLEHDVLIKSPLWMQKKMMKYVIKLAHGHHSKYDMIAPLSDVYASHPTINSEVLNYVKNGKLKVYPKIQRVEDHTVFFENGESESFDMIVSATGYNLSYPFLPKELQRVKGAVAQVYGGSMLDDFKGLYLYGWLQVRGGVGSVVGPSAKLLARMVELQESVNEPLGCILKKMGQKIPTSHLADPYKLLARVKKIEKFWSFFEKKVRKLDTEEFKANATLFPEDVDFDLVVN